MFSCCLMSFHFQPIALCSCLTYNIGFPTLFFQTFFRYSLGSSFNINSTMVPSSSMCTSLSMSACKSAPGTFVTATHHPYLASTAHDIIMALSDTVGELVSVFCHIFPLGHTSAHPLAFIIPSLFSFRNVGY